MTFGSGRYLHKVCMPPIAHKNFKVANILLDDNLYPHLSNSGVATCPLRAECQVPMHILNSFGDIAPEHAMAGIYTTKSDIYSFGVVLLELLIGRMPYDWQMLKLYWCSLYHAIHDGNFLPKLGIWIMILHGLAMLDFENYCY